MKKLLLLLILPFLSQAQSSISATDIIKMINDGQDVMLTNSTITGVLDLTELNNKEELRKSDYIEYKAVVPVKLSFENCVFRQDFLAYKNSGDNWKNGTTYTADFDQSVEFLNCTFKGVFAAKYSDFQETATFEGSEFRGDANFKYAKFKEFAGFGNVKFNSEATFKYAKFLKDADFYNNYFDDTADFKYAKFSERATFKRTTFDDFADFKYAEFTKNGVFTESAFNADVSFKYTKGKVYQN